MYTIDEMIERLKELRDIAPDGGKTPVVIYTQDCKGDALLEFAAAELQNASPHPRAGEMWVVDDKDNTCTLLKIY